MARKTKQHKIDKKMIIDAFGEMAKEKNIDKNLLQGIIEETLSLIVKKRYGNRADFEIVVNMQKGDIEIYLIKQVVEVVENAETEITLEEANMFSAEPLSIGDDFIEEITLDNIADSFGRRLVFFASQIMNQRIREIERDNLFQKYSERQNELIVGEIYQKKNNLMIIMHEGNEMKLLKEDQIESDNYMFKKNKPIKAVIKEVVRAPGGVPEIYLTRTSDEFVKRLFEMEIPEVNDEVILIKGIAREPGERTKVALLSVVDRVDPVGACVGLKGIRINSITRELGNENIDLIPWSDEVDKLLERSLAPAKIKEVHISPETKTATVIAAESQVSLAVGRMGLNVRLASTLTGYEIKIVKEGGEDIEINEFEEELGSDVMQRLQEMNILTARDFLDADPEVLFKDCEMSYNSILENRRIMLLEFEEKENEDYVTKLNFIVANANRVYDDEYEEGVTITDEVITVTEEGITITDEIITVTEEGVTITDEIITVIEDDIVVTEETITVVTVTDERTDESTEKSATVEEEATQTNEDKDTLF